MTLQELRGQIWSAFPAACFRGLATSCDCDECMEIRKGLQGKCWDEVPSAFIDLTCSPVLMTPHAYVAFLPAYLLRALDDLEGRTLVAEFTVYSLCPNAPEGDREEERVAHLAELHRLLERVRRMNPGQVQAIRAFLLFVQDNGADGERLRPFVSQALERVWRVP